MALCSRPTPTKGHVIWEFASGEPLASPAYVAGDTVYVGSVDRNLFAIDTKDGTQRWVTPGVTRSSRTVTGRCTAKRQPEADRAGRGHRQCPRPGNAGGRRNGHRESSHRPDLSARGRGPLALPAEFGRTWPTVHVELAKPDETEHPPSRPANGPANRLDPPWTRLPRSAARDEDPFGMGEDEDPFGSGDEEEDPFATGDEEEDPFGTSDETEDEDPFGP